MLRQAFVRVGAGRIVCVTGTPEIVVERDAGRGSVGWKAAGSADAVWPLTVTDCTTKLVESPPADESVPITSVPPCASVYP